MSASLADALARLTQAARDLGVDETAARVEAELVSAAVAESNRGAYLAWCAQVGAPASAETFMDAAVRGRRYRSSPTPLASYAATLRTAPAQAYQAALADVCAAAALLGEPGPASLGAAQMAGAAQLGTAASSSPTPLPDDAAEREFVAKAPGILADVLARLGEAQRPLLDLSSVSPLTPGAIPGLGTPPTGSTSGPAAVAAPSAQPEKAAEPAPAPAPTKTVEEWLAELDALIGLAAVKAEIRRQTAILRVDALRTKAGLKSTTITRHLIFTGNPGTGKTTVARMVSGIYQAIGLLTKGQLVEVDRSELVAGYLGQTAIKTSEVVAKAIGGVLFIDEAYSLAGDQYGEEAINTLVKEMEDHRDDLVVIVAGYPAPMAVFISENPGLTSRFRTTIEFADYTDAELEGIFKSMASNADYDLADGCMAEFDAQLAAQTRDESFGNGRFARNVFEAAIGRHAWRLRDQESPSLQDLRTLLPQDVAPDPAPAVDWPPAEPAEPPDPPAQP